VESVAAVKALVRNSWIRLLIIDPEQRTVNVYDNGQWSRRRFTGAPQQAFAEETIAS
jgi:uncharacterized protein YbcC (UPF0753/DUF2309 family)